VIGPALQLAAAEASQIATTTELAEAASQTAYLIGALRQAGERLGASPPHAALVELQGLRRWSLAILEEARLPKP
jgi:hypothetical protein